MSDELIEWRERIGVKVMYAMRCAHQGDDFGDKAVCVTCFESTQRIGGLIERETHKAREEGRAEAWDEGAEYMATSGWTEPEYVQDANPYRGGSHV